MNAERGDGSSLEKYVLLAESRNGVDRREMLFGRGLRRVDEFSCDRRNAYGLAINVTERSR